MNFYHINHFPDLPLEFVAEAVTAEYWNYDNDDVSMAYSTFKNTKFAQDFGAKFGEIRCGYMRFDPMTTYNWHKDTLRTHALNFLVTDIPNILTLYRAPTQRGMISKLENVDPKFRRPVLLNGGVEHCVLNYNETQTRCILGLCAADESVTFDDVQTFLEQYQVSDDMFNIVE